MSTAELPCYTLINVPSDFETPNEMQLKQDLEKASQPGARAARPWIIVWSHRPLYCSDLETWYI